MTNLEKLQKARDYITALANGVDPFNGEELEAHSVINDVRLSRCLFFVGDTLSSLIEGEKTAAKNGGEKRKNPRLLPFYLVPDYFPKIEVSNEPIVLKKFADRINMLVDETAMKKLAPTALTSWLLEKGFLCEEIHQDKKRKKPTETGNELGITAELREGEYGKYLAILYNQNAQKFIIDHLEEIAAQ